MPDARRPLRAPVTGVLALLVLLAGSLAGAGCGGSGSAADQAATATTFGIDTTTVTAMKSLVEQANTAALLSASGRGATALQACTTAWNRVRTDVAARDAQTARSLDAALAALGAAVRARNTTAAADAATSVATAAARYTRLYP